MKKKVLAVILTVAILSSLVVTTAGAASVSDFADVSSDSWYYESVDFVSSKGYMIGVGTTPETFAPEYNMTRAMFVTVLARVAGVKVDNTKSSFDDVKVNEWYTGAVAWAVEAEITTGVGGNNFAPDAFVTREDMATFMSRFVTWYSKTTGNSHRNQALVESFTDAASIRDYAKDAVEQCRQWGLINGYDTGAFGPQDFSTRAQVAAVISRLYWIINAGPLGDTHKVTVTLSKTPAITINNVVITPEIEYTFSDGDTVKTIVDGLIGDNQDAIEGFVKRLVTSESFKTYSNGFSARGVDVNVEVTNGTVSATATASMSTLISLGLANATAEADTSNIIPAGDTETAKKLLDKIQTSGVESVTAADLGTLNYIVANQEKITAENVQKYLDKASLTVNKSAEEIVDQAKSYVTDVIEPVQENIQEQITTELGLDSDATLADINTALETSETVTPANVSVNLSDEEIAELNNRSDEIGTVTVSVDLAAYLEKLTSDENFGDGTVKGNLVDRTMNYLKSVAPKGTYTETDIENYVKAICNVGFVTGNSETGTVTFSTNETLYYNYIVGVKDAALQLYSKLGSEANYTSIVNNLIQKAKSMGATVTCSEDQVKAIASILKAGKVSHDNAAALGEVKVEVVPSEAYPVALAYLTSVAGVPASIRNALTNYAPEELPETAPVWVDHPFTATVTVK